MTDYNNKKNDLSEAHEMETIFVSTSAEKAKAKQINSEKHCVAEAKRDENGELKFTTYETERKGVYSIPVKSIKESESKE